MTPGPIPGIVEARRRARAAGDPLVDVCFLATVTAERTPEARPLTLRDIGDEGFGVLINRSSPKWADIERSGRAGLLIYWPLVEAQYRVRGTVRIMSDEQVARYWGRKTHESRLLEHFYEEYERQSRPIAAREVLTDGIEALRRRHPIPVQIPVPPGLVGLLLVTNEIETWNGAGPTRLHDRRLHRLEAGGWTERILVP